MILGSIWSPVQCHFSMDTEIQSQECE